MIRFFNRIIVLCLMGSCLSGDDDINEAPFNAENLTTVCEDARYSMYKESPYVLPYAVGKSYRVDLNQCSSSYHGPGQPDQFAEDFAMFIGTEITAVAQGVVVFVEESGEDFGFPNNKVVVKSGDDYMQYMHLTNNGAFVEVGDQVSKGSLIGKSGATGLAGYPHLHFVITRGGYEYPYNSIPHNFSNTIENPRGPESGRMYMAEPY